MCDLRNIVAARLVSAVQSHSSHFWEKAVSSARGLYQAIQSLNIGGEVRSRAAAGVPEKIRYLGSSSRLVASTLALLLLMVALPASPASAVTVVTEAPKLTAVELVSAPTLAPGQTARVRFTLSQPAQRVEFNYYDESLSTARKLTWSGNPGVGAFTAEATATVGADDYYDGPQRLSSVAVTYQQSGWDYPLTTQFLRDSNREVVTVDGRGDPRLQLLDFSVANPSRLLLVPQNIVPPKFEPWMDRDWNGTVDGTVSPGSWTPGIKRIWMQWIVDGRVVDYGSFEANESFPVWTFSGNQGNLKVRIITTTPGYKSVSADSESQLFVTANRFAITGKPWIGSTLNTDFDIASIKGIPVGASPKVEVIWRSESTSYLPTTLALGEGYRLKGADGGGTVRASVVVTFDGKVVGRFSTDSSAYVTNPTPSRNYVNREVNDFLMARTTDGRLWMWGRQFGAFPREVGSGWNVFDKIFSPGDFNEDGYADVLARKPSGELWMYPADGQHWWKPASRVGVGWQGMTELIAPGDFDEDGHDDVLARDREGRLLLYPGNGKGGWLAPRQVGAGWNIFNRVFSTGDFDGDSHADILATNVGGQLFLYSSNGKGGWLGSKVIGSGWQSFKGVLNAGDRDYDGWTDIYGIDGAGYMYLYPFKSGSWKPRTLVGADWDVFTALF
ncbi:FG-GAP repeat domain-containing protein [Paenarthrobacter sp. AB444]|uniref:FG-GAP repeat domain-containing protein n=1 Tax=Paenarthrobacter sp. AB444 TaxID=3025681 RepID=UPI0023673A96|nr:VCBS repeat-containing protein [Paenarthrobacter sp. AB444]MDD7834423.1 VCBS repeat-containing protein [Paenarthrobacter sp. AB444]